MADVHRTEGTGGSATSQTARGRSARHKAARELAEILDSKLFKALCEPVRVEIVKFLTAEGRSDAGTVAANFSQDASVISRHLAVLHDARVVRREKIGRHVFFELDGSHILAQMEAITQRCRNILPICCKAASS